MNKNLSCSRDEIGVVTRWTNDTLQTLNVGREFVSSYIPTHTPPQTLITWSHVRLNLNLLAFTTLMMALRLLLLMVPMLGKVVNH